MKTFLLTVLLCGVSSSCVFYLTCMFYFLKKLNNEVGTVRVLSFFHCWSSCVLQGNWSCLCWKYVTRARCWSLFGRAVSSLFCCPGQCMNSFLWDRQSRCRCWSFFDRGSILIAPVPVPHVFYVNLRSSVSLCGGGVRCDWCSVWIYSPILIETGQYRWGCEGWVWCVWYFWSRAVSAGRRWLSIGCCLVSSQRRIFAGRAISARCRPAPFGLKLLNSIKIWSFFTTDGTTGAPISAEIEVLQAGKIGEEV